MTADVVLRFLLGLRPWRRRLLRAERSKRFESCCRHTKPLTGLSGLVNRASGVSSGSHLVPPTRHITNPNMLVSGVPVTVATAHAKIRRDGSVRGPS